METAAYVGYRRVPTGAVLLALLLLACAAREPAAVAPPPAPAAPACTLLTVNDTYRIEPNADGTGGMARLRTVRKELEAEGDVLLLHAGDFLYPSLLSRTYKGAQMVEVLDALDGDPAAQDRRMYVVFGNHEFDAGKMKDGPGLAATIASSQFRWLGTNIQFVAADDTPEGQLPGPHLGNLVRHDLVECGGLKVGLFGITTNRKSAAYVERFDDPVGTARSFTAELRRAGADVVVALTHQSVDEDLAMLRALAAEGPDLVVGGHEHNQVRAEEGGRPVYKADADAHSAWRITLRRGPGGITHDAELRTLSADIPEDPAVKAIVDARVAQHDRDFCGAHEEPVGCLAMELARTKVPLTAAELDIRRFETNFGNWIADVARAAFPDAQIALVNSGSLRLNRDLAPGPIRRQDIEEMFAYPMPLARIEIDGATLEKVVARAVQEWTGNGHWLQVSGFAWLHDPVAGSGTRLTLLSTGKPIAPTDRLVAVVPEYLVDPSGDQDGYTMLPKPPANPGARPNPDLKQLVLDALAAKPDGIAPAVEGRICNPQRPATVCLAAP